MKKLLIAEISNHHMGDMDKARELIRVARDSGANAVKGQAFKAEDIKSGSMDREFYEESSLRIGQYLDLIYYGMGLGIPVFFSIFNSEFDDLLRTQKYRKVSRYQYETMPLPYLKVFDNKDTLISINRIKEMFFFEKAQILWVGDYCKEPDLKAIRELQLLNSRPIGISDHSVGVNRLIPLLKEFDFPVIEKHFHLGGELVHNGKTYRDSLHSANPQQFEELAKEFLK